jgi:hypothetical protein
MLHVPSKQYGVEALVVRNLVKNLKLAKSIAEEASWFIRILAHLFLQMYHPDSLSGSASRRCVCWAVT